VQSADGAHKDVVEAIIRMLTAHLAQRGAAYPGTSSSGIDVSTPNMRSRPLRKSPVDR
jgi:hypothetical protein